jgi:DNA-binding NarL/FixJ family response regulator
VLSGKLKPLVPISVLVIDSNPAFLRFVVQYLEERHSEMIRVAGAAFRESDALILAAAISPQVILVGISGPLYTALGLIANVRRLMPSLAVVAMSQLGAAGYAQVALEAGATAFVDKDRLRADLAPAILQAGCGPNTLR